MQHDAARVIEETNRRFKNFYRRTQMENHPIEEKINEPEPQAGDGKEYPESISDPPRPSIAEIEKAIDQQRNIHLKPDGTVSIEDDEPSILGAGLASLPILGYDALEPLPAAIEMAARIAHAVVEAMNRSFNETTLDWATSGPSCIAGVRRVLENPGETAEQNHEAWMAYKAAEGWTYGPVKDATLKTHPCMIPYQALGPFQQSKDAVFHAVVRTMFGVK